jgi:hypothetical protein
LETCDDQFDLSFAFVGRLAKKVSVVLLGQMRRQEPDSAEMDAAVGEERQDHRKPSRRARGFDPVEGGVLGEVQDLRAVREHRRAALSKVEAPRIELSECRDQARSGLRFTSGEPLHFGDQLFVGEAIMNEA